MQQHYRHEQSPSDQVAHRAGSLLEAGTAEDLDWWRTWRHYVPDCAWSVGPGPTLGFRKAAINGLRSWLHGRPRHDEDMTPVLQHRKRLFAAGCYGIGLEDFTCRSGALRTTLRLRITGIHFQNYADRPDLAGWGHMLVQPKWAYEPFEQQLEYETSAGLLRLLDQAAARQPFDRAVWRQLARPETPLEG